MDIYDLHAENTPDRTAVVFEDRRLPWPEFALLTRKAANALIALGLQPGDRLATLAHNSDELLVASAGARSAGGVVVPVNWHLTVPEVNYVLRDCEASILVADDEHIETALGAAEGTEVRDIVAFGTGQSGERVHRWTTLLADAAEHSPQRPSSVFGSYMMYTSGTTGRPKGALSASPDADVGIRYAEAFNLSWDDVHLVCGPLYHSAPSAFCGMALAFGSTAVVMKKFDALEALAIIERERVTTTFMAPILLSRLVSQPAEVDTSSLRSIIVAGAPCPFELKVGAERRFGQVLYEFYGSTETKAALLIGPADQMRKPGSCGTPFPGVAIKVVRKDGADAATGETGEIWVGRSTSSFDGYHRDPEKTRETIVGDWIRSGDIGYFDEEGFYYIVDRVDDMILSGGVNVYPAEIEAALNDHPSVQDCAVFGIPDAEYGQRVHATVQLKEGSIAADDLSAYLKSRLAGFKIPRSWEFTSERMRGDDGKLRKRLLRADLLSREASRR